MTRVPDTYVDEVLMQYLRGFGTVEICDILHINNNITDHGGACWQDKRRENQVLYVPTVRTYCKYLLYVL